VSWPFQPGYPTILKKNSMLKNVFWLSYLMKLFEEKTTINDDCKKKNIDADRWKKDY
jgi:hypothetical protein